jgi:hypothetical protein
MQLNLDNSDSVCAMLEALREKGWAIVAYDKETLDANGANREEVEDLLVEVVLNNWDMW